MVVTLFIKWDYLNKNEHVFYKTLILCVHVSTAAAAALGGLTTGYSVTFDPTPNPIKPTHLFNHSK